MIITKQKNGIKIVRFNFTFTNQQLLNINENINVLSIRPHKKSCRGLEFSHDGSCMFYLFFKRKRTQYVNYKIFFYLII